MARFSNHCNNRFRGAFRHAVNQGIKEYNRNKQSNNKQDDFEVSDETFKLFMRFFGVIVWLVGNYYLFSYKDYRYTFKEDSGLIFYSIVTFIIDVFFCYLGAKKISGKINNLRLSRVIKVVITIFFVSLLIVLFLEVSLQHCHKCGEFLFEPSNYCYDCIQTFK